MPADRIPWYIVAVLAAVALLDFIVSEIQTRRRARRALKRHRRRMESWRWPQS